MVGVAAHIRAASPGGARFDNSLTPEQRKDITNGIWLCQDDAKLIDDDELQFTVAFLECMKNAHEAEVMERVLSGSGGTRPTDEEILTSIATVLDRPAMSERFGNCQPSDFQKAIADIIEALNTGVHRLRDGLEIKRMPTRHELRSPAARQALADIVNELGELRTFHADLLRSGAVKPCGCTAGEDSAVQLDDLRRRILDGFRKLKPDFAVYVRSRSFPAGVPPR